MHKNGVLTYLHGNHLGSTVFMTNLGLTYQTGEGYYAYGPGALRARTSNIPLTDHKFTAPKGPPKRDREPRGRGLQSFNAQGSPGGQQQLTKAQLRDNANPA